MWFGLLFRADLRNRTGMDAGARRRVMRSARRGEYEASVAS